MGLSPDPFASDTKCNTISSEVEGVLWELGDLLEEQTDVLGQAPLRQAKERDPGLVASPAL